MAGSALDQNAERTMSADHENDSAFNEKLIEDVLSAYPEKFAKRRRKHLNVAKAASADEAPARTARRSANARSNPTSSLSPA